jgi:hypothetical protein
MYDADLAIQTMFSELLQRCLDAGFDEQFPQGGTFARKKVKSRFYWHYQWRDGETVRTKYVGPVTDQNITERVERFADLKASAKRRQTLARALIATGLPATDQESGSIVDAMWRAGFFRLRGVLVGTLAFQAYAGILGLKLPRRPLMTQDADFAQFWGISENIGDSMDAPLDVLRRLDPSFKAVPHLTDPFVSVRYRNKLDYAVDILTPNRGSDDHMGKPVRMKALANTDAEPLRHLDFLIHEPEQSLLLYKSGVPVTIPRAERFAVHKLIVAVERREQAKSGKDIDQAATLILSLARQRPRELASAWRKAWATGERWKEKLASGRARLPEPAREALTACLRRERA